MGLSSRSKASFVAIKWGDIILLLVVCIQFSKRIATNYEVPFPFFSHAAHYGAITSYITPLFMLFRHVSLLEIEMQNM
jgi:hypothetical protein